MIVTTVDKHTMHYQHTMNYKHTMHYQLQYTKVRKKYIKIHYIKNQLINNTVGKIKLILKTSSTN